MRRRALIACPWPLLLPAALSGCAVPLEAPEVSDARRASAAPAGASAPAGAAPAPLVTPWRNVNGGFLAPPTPGTGLPPRAASGMFVRFLSPGAVALRGQDMLVADVGAARLWRVDPWSGSLIGIPGAPVMPGTALVLGPDLSAWVFDPGSRQVLRFTRDNRLAQSWRVGPAFASPVALALADGGATLLVADGAGAMWSEQRTASGIVSTISPVREDGMRIAGVDGLALAHDGSVFVLDRQAGVVHRVRRDGRVLDTLGRGELQQPVAIAADRFDRVFVHDAQSNAILCLRSGRAAERLGTTRLGVQRIAGLAVDDRWLAVADGVTAQVALLQLSREAAP